MIILGQYLKRNPHFSEEFSPILSKSTTWEYILPIIYVLGQLSNCRYPPGMNLKILILENVNNVNPIS